ncbi:MAG: nucleotidyl transferase AbiEii/AbiGii toxin family protein [Bacteroidales bacterium]|nr:nucleotidyl transferase AbiEii/AbiGii toxin family protein [Bacteroidales bacterium]
MLRTDTLSEQTLVLLKRLQTIPLFKDLRLVGGTALVLQLGHRESVDLDLFGNVDTDYETVQQAIISVDKECRLLNATTNIWQFMVANVKVDIVNYPYKWIDDAMIEAEITLASIKDIAAMKLAAITGRGTKKDFVDLYFLLQHFTLPEMFGFFNEKYPNVDLFMTYRSVVYFEDAEQTEMPVMLITTEWEDVKEKIRQEIRKL